MDHICPCSQIPKKNAMLIAMLPCLPAVHRHAKAPRARRKVLLHGVGNHLGCGDMDFMEMLRSI